MLSTRTTTSKIDNLGEKVTKGVRRGMEDAADAGFAVAFDESPDGATSGYRLSWKEPTWVGDTLVWGNTSPYAWAIEEGLDPGHWIPVSAIPNLSQWAARVLGASDPDSAAWGVRHNIAQDGTEGQEVAAAGVEEQKQVLQQQGLVQYIEEEL